MNDHQYVAFGERKVGDGEPIFVTYEAGPTHEGVESAKDLIRHAARAGADAVKFQIFDPDRVVEDKSALFTYEILVDRETGKTETVQEPLYDLLKRRALSNDEWREVKACADECNLAFFATIGFPDEVDLVESLGCASIKIASGDVNHFPLIRKAARTGMCLQLDTGNSTIGEIERAIDVIRSEGNDNVIIHHCPSGYPARLEGINLNIIPSLKTLLGYPVAFSDHSPGWDMDVAAVALGANLVEKTITKDRMTRSIEHIFSLEPQDMAAFVQLMRDLPTALGSSRRIMQPVELEKREIARRSTYLAEDTPAGRKLKDCALDYRRPGGGLAPDQAEALGEQSLRTDLPAGHKVMPGDLA
ncbi:N-acetylneuraminate synthase [Hwanghaeella grinnelliae]|uniref:N-acetylneuraminate synthase n=1 Tax=Hwanghaeella grinnelliae TaxID=2500179 RepID=A0A3S2VMZ8_9PROT|nr:N-acetylneuraminate synthase family protein [Hwanghaeella grinnelliae]RVU36763.1 N-acetylneuraminate synthase [Hwanghaeella grinnelliae]